MHDQHQESCGQATLQGVVFRKQVGHYYARAGGRVMDCAMSSRLRKQLEYPTADAASLRHRVVSVGRIRVVDPVAVGDFVEIEDGGNDTGMITAVLPRRNQFSRRAPGNRPEEQVVAANIDQIIVVVSAANPRLRWGLVDRYLADAEFAEIPAVVCITKMDLAEGEARTGIEADAALYRSLGYPVLLASAVGADGVDSLRTTLRGSASMLVGHSGVGKSSLLNALQPGLGLRVQQVSHSTGKGKHTTVHLEAFDLAGGGSVIDTPGIRQLALWDTGGIDKALLFREMAPYLGQCRFGGSCSHSHEPGCAIKRAVEQGEIAYRRYRSFLGLTDDSDRGDL